MTTNFPNSLDNFSNPGASSSQSAGPRTHSQQHGDLNDAMEAVQASIGVSALLPGEVARSHRDKARERISIKDFGAYGDGGSHPASTRFASLALAQAAYPACLALTDELDSLAFLAARDYFQTNSDYRGGEIYIPRGNYKMNRTVAFTPYNVLHGMKITGDGPTATTLNFATLPASSDAIVINTNGAHFELSDMMITSATRDNVVIGSGVSVGGATFNSFITVSNIRSQQAGRHGLSGTNFFLSTIKDCWFKGNVGNGMSINGYSTALKISRCEASSNAYGFTFNGIIYSTVDTCGSDNNLFGGYVCSNLRGVTFIGCGAEANARDGFLVLTSTASAAGIPSAAQDIRGVNFVGCYAIGNSTLAAGTYGSFLTASTADGRTADFKILGGSSSPGTAGDRALILAGGSGKVTCHKELFDDAGHTTADSMTGTTDVKNATVAHRRCVVTRSTNQSLANGALVTIAFDTVSINELGATHAAGVITIPKGVNKIRIHAAVYWDASGAGTRYLSVLKNGVGFLGGPISRVPGTASVEPQFVSSMAISVVAGDTFQLQAVQDSGGALNAQTGNYTYLAVEALN